MEREWHDGDTVEVRLPMSLRFEAFADDPARGAFVYGPIVLAADLGAQGLDDTRRYGMQAPEPWLADAPAVPVLAAAGPEAALSRVRATADPLSFRTDGLGRPHDVDLRPFFRLGDRRYAVYLDVLDAAGLAARQAGAEAQASADRALAARTVDTVTAGDEADERAHALEKGGGDSGWFTGRRYRGARWGDGEFSYRLALPASGPAAVRVLYWGGDSRRHRFEVLVDGRPIASQQLFDDRPGEVLPVEYALPEDLTRGRSQVRVGIRPMTGSSTGVVFEVRTVRPSP